MSEKKLKAIDKEFELASIEVQHLIKYNIYMLSKSIIFHAVSKGIDDPEEAIEATNNIMEQLDLENQKQDTSENQ